MKLALFVSVMLSCVLLSCNTVTALPQPHIQVRGPKIHSFRDILALNTTFSPILGAAYNVSIHREEKAVLDYLRQLDNATVSSRVESFLQTHDQVMNATKNMMTNINDLLQDSAAAAYFFDAALRDFTLYSFNTSAIVDLNGDPRDRYDRILTTISGLSSRIIKFVANSSAIDTKPLVDACNNFNTKFTEFAVETGDAFLALTDETGSFSDLITVLVVQDTFDLLSDYNSFGQMILALLGFGSVRPVQGSFADITKHDHDLWYKLLEMAAKELFG